MRPLLLFAPAPSLALRMSSYAVLSTRRKQHNPRELFLSDHIEEQALEAIARKVTMKKISDIPNLDEYCKGDGNYFYTRKWDHETHEFEDL